MDTVSVVIPTLNEEKAIGQVLDQCHTALEHQDFETEIIVVDGNSGDRTTDIAREKGAKIIVEKRKGKGIAIQTAFKRVDSDYVVMMDGDCSYDPEDISRILEPLRRDEADFTLGERQYQEGSMTRLNTVGNKIISGMVRTLYNIPVYDVCTGYWAFKREVIDILRHTDAAGFDLEASMLIRAFHAGFHPVEIPVTYRPRKGKAKLHPIKGGVTIIGTIVRMLRDYNPLMLFGGISVISFVIGLFLGFNVITMFQKYEEIMIGRALLTLLFILIGVQSLFFGLLSDMILRRDVR